MAAEEGHLNTKPMKWKPVLMFVATFLDFATDILFVIFLYEIWDAKGDDIILYLCIAAGTFLFIGWLNNLVCLIFFFGKHTCFYFSGFVCQIGCTLDCTKTKTSLLFMLLRFFRWWRYPNIFYIIQNLASLSWKK